MTQPTSPTDEQSSARTRRHVRARRALSLVDVVVVLVLIAVLAGLWVSMLSRARGRSRVQQCMNRLHTIAAALQNYRNAHSNQDPRTAYVPGARPDLSGAGADATDPFGPGGPPANNVPAAFFLLLRAQNLPTINALCPAALAAAPGRFAPDDCGGLGPFARSNFTDVRRNLSYSFFFTYTDASGKGQTGLPIAADLNPGAAANVGQVAAADIDANPAKYRAANSNNHGKAGQLVLYDDFSVQWYTTPFAGALIGVHPDNIYATRKNTVVDTPADATDSILLPAEE